MAAQNRYLLVQMHFGNNDFTKTLTVSSTNLLDIIPPKTGLVCIPFWQVTWSIRTVLSAEQMDIEYIIQVDPGGNLRRWLINMIAAVGPLSVLS